MQGSILVFLQVVSQASMSDDILAQVKFYLPVNIHVPCDALWDGYNMVEHRVLINQLKGISLLVEN